MTDLGANPTEIGPLRCHSCGGEIRDGNWFARVQHRGARIVFCRPTCVEKFLDTPELQAAGRNFKVFGNQG